MNLNGIWKVEMLSQYGWEPFTTAFLEDGRFFDGGNEHYSVGTYQCRGDELTVDVLAVTHGRMETMFGERSPRQQVHFEGRVSNNLVTGLARVPKSDFIVSFRASRVADLP